MTRRDRTRHADPPRRMGRPPLGARSREPITLRLDPTLLDTLRAVAARRGIGYQSLIHELLTQAVADVHDR
jgi:uncharacterized protein (DUF4415 family)